MIKTYLIAIVVGALAETIAKIARLWVYRKPINPVINVLIMFGLVMGGLSLTVSSLGHFPVLIIASIIGYAYEQLNFSVLGWWDFPDDQFLVFKGKQACAVSVGIMWGFVPLIINLLSNQLLNV